MKPSTHSNRKPAMQAVLVAVAAAGLLAGCLTTPTSGSLQFRPDGIPDRSYYVGGGFVLNYKVPSVGTVYVVEETRRRLWLTQSVNAGELFEFSIEPGDEETQKFQGSDLGNAKFSLYFIPASIEMAPE